MGLGRDASQWGPGTARWQNVSRETRSVMICSVVTEQSTRLSLPSYRARQPPAVTLIPLPPPSSPAFSSLLFFFSGEHAYTHPHTRHGTHPSSHRAFAFYADFPHFFTSLLLASPDSVDRYHSFATYVSIRPRHDYQLS